METTTTRPVPADRLRTLYPTAHPDGWRWVSGQRLRGTSPAGPVLVALSPPWSGADDMVAQTISAATGDDPQRLAETWLLLLSHLRDRAESRAACASGRPADDHTGACPWCGTAVAQHDHAVDTYLDTRHGDPWDHPTA